MLNRNYFKFPFPGVLSSLIYLTKESCLISFSHFMLSLILFLYTYIHTWGRLGNSFFPKPHSLRSSACEEPRHSISLYFSAYWLSCWTQLPLPYRVPSAAFTILMVYSPKKSLNCEANPGIEPHRVSICSEVSLPQRQKWRSIILLKEFWSCFSEWFQGSHTNRLDDCQAYFSSHYDCRSNPGLFLALRRETHSAFHTICYLWFEIIFTLNFYCHW